MLIKLKQLHKIILTKILILSVLNLKGSDFDTTSILKKIDLQIESTSSINKMYNFQFDDAEKEFLWLSQEYKNHPLPFFSFRIKYVVEN